MEVSSAFCKDKNPKLPGDSGQRAKEPDMASSRKTSVRAAKAASSVLKSNNSSKPAKTAAASALSQREPKARKK